MVGEVPNFSTFYIQFFFMSHETYEEMNGNENFLQVGFGKPFSHIRFFYALSSLVHSKSFYSFNLLFCEKLAF